MIKFIYTCFILLALIPLSIHSQVPVQEEAPLYDIYETVEVEEPTNERYRLGYYSGKDGKKGLFVNGKKITEAIYDKAIIASRKGYIVKQNGKFGFLNLNAEAVISIKYDSIYDFRDKFLVVKKKEKYGTFDYDGNKNLSIKYPKILGGNNSGFILTEDKNKKLQLLDYKGKQVFKEVLDEVNIYQNGVIARSKDKHAFAVKTFKTGFEYDSIVLKSYKAGSKKPKFNSTKKPYKFNYQKLNHIIVKKEGKVGLVDTLNTTLIPIANDGIILNSAKRYYSVQKDKKMGVYLLKCNKYIAPEYDRVYMDGTSFLQITKGTQKGLIDDATGQMILPIAYKGIYKQDTIFVVTKSRKKGVFNRKGKQLVPIKYDDIDNLGGFLSHEYDGLLKVKIDTLFGLVNGKNKTILPVEYTWLNDFENELIITGKNKKYGLFDSNGKEIQPLIYDNIKRKRASMSKVYFTIKDGLYGVLTEDGNILHENNFKSIQHIHDSDNDLNLISPYSKYYLQIVHKGGREGVIDGHTGKFVIPLKNYKILQYLNNQLNNRIYFLIKKDNHYGIVDDNNKILIDFEYEDLDISKTTFYYSSRENALNNVTIVAKKNNTYGIINLSNQIVVPFKYKSLKKIASKGLFKAKLNTHFILINVKGEVINNGPFEEISNFEVIGYNNTAKALSFYDGRMREIDEKGKFISTAVPMQPHKGFTSFSALKLELIEAMESKNDTLLLNFVDKISPSKHLVHWLKNADKRIASKVRYLDYDKIRKTYFRKLLEFKRYSWNSTYFDKNNLYTEDFTEIAELGLTMNKRVSDWAYDDTRILEKFLRNSLKINGYWISSYFVNRRI